MARGVFLFLFASASVLPALARCLCSCCGIRTRGASRRPCAQLGDVRATMEDGVLTVRVAGFAGAEAEAEPPEEVPLL